MSKDWVKDINEMHSKFGVHTWMESQISQPKGFNKTPEFMSFRLNFLKEELNETIKAYEEKNAEEVVDGLIDLCVVAIGTLDAFGVDAYKAWDEIYNANMMKNVGVKEGRPNPLGLPDLIKPDNWKNPSHEGNHGSLHNAL